MSIFKMPLQNVPQQFAMTFGVTEYLVTCRWNDAEDAGWALDFVDAITNVSVVSNIPLITGANLFAGLEYLGFEGILFCYTDGDDFATPTLLNLGVESNVYFNTDVVING